MGLLDKTRIVNKGTNTKTEDLSVKELEFLLAKLRSATYIGSEFELFYKVWVKISDKIDSLKE